MRLHGNKDGKAECYYFDPNGYVLVGTTTPDGYTVNADGAWTVNGAVQSKDVSINGGAASGSGSGSGSTSSSETSTGVNFEDFDWQLEQKHTHDGVKVEKYLGVYDCHHHGFLSERAYEIAILSDGTLHFNSMLDGEANRIFRINNTTWRRADGNTEEFWIIEDGGATIRTEYYINDGKYDGINLREEEGASTYYTKAKE